MSKFDVLLLSAQELLLDILEYRLLRQNHLNHSCDSDVEMVDQEFFDEPVQVDPRSWGICYSKQSETCAEVIQSRQHRI